MWSVGGGNRWTGRRRGDRGRYGRDGICGKQAVSDLHGESDAECARECDGGGKPGSEYRCDSGRGSKLAADRRRDPDRVRNAERERDINARCAIAIWSNGKSSLP